MADKKKPLTAAQKRERDFMTLQSQLIAQFEAETQELNDTWEARLAKENTSHYHLGFDQGYKAAEAVYKSQKLIDRLLGKSL